MECKSAQLRKLLEQLTVREEAFNQFVVPEPLPFEAELQACASNLSAHSAKGEALEFRRCQACVLTYLKELLKRAYAVPEDCKRRGQALLLLIDVSVHHPEAAYLVAESGLFAQAVHSNLACGDQSQQGLLLLTVCLAAAVAHHVPESQTFRSFLTALVDLACDYGSFKPFRLVQIHSVEALVHLCYGSACRRHLGQELCSGKVESLLRATQYRSSDGMPVRQHTFLVCLLLANLCDLPVPVASVDSAGSPATLATFGYVGFASLWTSDDFFVCLAAATAAAVRREPWPQNTEMRWPPWKLVQTIERLSRHGYAAELRLCATPMMTLISQTSRTHQAQPRRSPRGSCKATQEALEQPVRVVRLAVEALRAIASAANDTEALRSEANFVGPEFVEVLQEHAEEMPAAEDLLGLFLRDRDPYPYLVHADLVRG